MNRYNKLLDKNALKQDCVLYCLPQIIIFLAFLFSCAINAQTLMNMQVKFKDSIYIDKYEVAKNGFKFQSIRLEPGDYKIENTKVPELLNQETITEIDLVYTDYPKGEDFTELNRKRLIELFMSCPNAFKHKTIIWRVVKQTGVKNQADLKNYFHGFVIYFRPLIPKETERQYFEKILAGKEKLKDSTLLKILIRNTKWKEMLCVADVTGSMSPYTVQLLVWAKHNERLRTFKQFVFFNDNDEKSNDQSGKLDTMGIWSIESFDAKKVHDKILSSMAKGNHIENDLEAIFFATQKYPNNIKHIILIADNLEDPCDMFLLGKLRALNIPIRVVICGINKAVNTNYLDIAYATNGSVHTIEEDITAMGKMENGYVFKICGMKFKLFNNRFHEIKS